MAGFVTVKHARTRGRVVASTFVGRKRGGADRSVLFAGSEAKESAITLGRVVSRVPSVRGPVKAMRLGPIPKRQNS